MASRIWNIIDCCWAFSGPDDDGGFSSGGNLVGVLGSGITRMWPCRRALQKVVGRNMFLPNYISAQLPWSAVALCAFKKRWREGGGAKGMMSTPTVLAARITPWDVGGRRSQPHVYLFESCCSMKTGQRASSFYKCVATSLRNIVSLEWYFGIFLWIVACCFILLSYHWWNHLVLRLSASSESGAARTLSYLIATT